MRRIDRTDINTPEHWNALYTESERGGWLCSGWKFDGLVVQSNLDKFLYPQMAGAKSCIEIGGGTGYGMNILSQAFPSIELWNVDISDVAVEKGKKQFPHIHHIAHDIHNPLNIGRQFDVLLCQEVIEHLSNPYIGVANMMDILTSDGLACFTAPYNECNEDAIEHLWTYNYNSVPELFFKYTDEVSVFRFTPIGGNLWFCVSYRKMGGSG